MPNIAADGTKPCGPAAARQKKRRFPLSPAITENASFRKRKKRKTEKPARASAAQRQEHGKYRILLYTGHRHGRRSFFRAWNALLRMPFPKMPRGCGARNAPQRMHFRYYSRSLFELQDLFLLFRVKAPAPGRRAFAFRPALAQPGGDEEEKTGEKPTKTEKDC